MTDVEKTTQETRSRLAPDPTPRRDFLGLAALGSAGAALLFGLVGMLRLPKAAVLPSPSKKFRVTLPETLGERAPFVPSGRSVAVVREGGAVYAVSTICTHLGCIVKSTPEGFQCPCHGSRFALDGSVVKGPAPQSLPWLSIQQIDASTYLVDEGAVVPQGSKVEV